MDGNSLNITQDLLEKLKELVPQAFSEEKLDMQKLQTLLGEAVNTDNERYQLSWAGKSEAYKVLQMPTTATLIPQPEQSVNWDESENIFIEGENLEVLKVLQKSYYGKIKMIYIDPPYNTGSDSFIYPDKFSETKEEYLKRIGEKDEEGYMMKEGLFRKNSKENGQFHSNWLNMMLPRLYLGRNLLKEDGVVVIHIDENELANLILLLDEVFGEVNQLGVITWDKGNPKGDARGIGYQHESIVVYAKNKLAFLEKNDLVRKKKNAEKMLKKAKDLFKKMGKVELPEELEQVVKNYKIDGSIFSRFQKNLAINEINEQFRNWIKKQDLSGGERAYNQIDENGDVFRLVSMAWPNKKKAPDDYFTPIPHPITKKNCPIPSRGWRYPSSTIKEMLERGEIIFGNDESVQPQRKYLLKNNLTENLPSVLFFGGSDDDFFNINKLEFENPKPLSFSKSIIESVTNNNTSDIILDFFAGSGTVGHAVLELNEETEGNRQFICVQLKEEVDFKSEAYLNGFRFISELTLERLKIAVQHCQEQRMNKLDFNKNAKPGFRFFSLNHSNFKFWRGDLIENEDELKSQMELFITPQKLSAQTSNILWELLIKNGVPLTEKIQEVGIDKEAFIYHTLDKRFAFVLDKYTPEVQENVLSLKPKTVICLDSLFQNQDMVKTNAQLKFEDNGVTFKTV